MRRTGILTICSYELKNRQNIYESDVEFFRVLAIVWFWIAIFHKPFFVLYKTKSIFYRKKKKKQTFGESHRKIRTIFVRKRMTT